jgi:hypothetical protein
MNWDWLVTLLGQGLDWLDTWLKDARIRSALADWLSIVAAVFSGWAW